MVLIKKLGPTRGFSPQFTPGKSHLFTSGVVSYYTQYIQLLRHGLIFLRYFIKK
jgi:hypothetical protein